MLEWDDSFVEVEWNGEIWDVSASYVPHVGIGEALDVARMHGFALPSPEMVDAIWARADLRLVPLPRRHDGTPRTMSSPEVYRDQVERIEAQIAGAPFKLLAGPFKDVVLLPTGKLALYGWHVPLEQAAAFTADTGVPLHPPASPSLPARVIQPVFGGHSAAWADYSQGARLVKRRE